MDWRCEMAGRRRKEKVKLSEVFRNKIRGLPEEQKRELQRADNFRMNVALAMVKLRQELGLSQKELAERLGVTQSWVSRLENANYDHRVESLWKYLNAMNAKLELKVSYRKAGMTMHLFVNDDLKNGVRFKVDYSERVGKESFFNLKNWDLYNTKLKFTVFSRAREKKSRKPFPPPEFKLDLAYMPLIGA